MFYIDVYKHNKVSASLDLYKSKTCNYELKVLLAHNLSRKSKMIN